MDNRTKVAVRVEWTDGLRKKQVVRMTRVPCVDEDIVMIDAAGGIDVYRVQAVSHVINNGKVDKYVEAEVRVS